MKTITAEGAVTIHRGVCSQPQREGEDTELDNDEDPLWDQREAEGQVNDV